MSNARDQADRLAELLSREHGAMAEFLVALAEFDRQRGWEELGFSSLFWFLHRRLGLSKGVAHYRGAAAELIQAHPEVVAPLRDGRLCLTSILELAKVLTGENSASVLPRYFGLSRREAAEITASIRPVEKPPVRDLVTSVATSPPAATSVATNRDIGVLVQPLEPLLRVTPRPSDSAVPLDEELRRLHVTVSRRLLAKIDMARDALSHTHPGASTEAVLEAGIDLILARHRKRRGVGATAPANPRRAAPARITADVKRRVWARDGGRCQWHLNGGGTCGSTTRLEFDHRVPRGLGGGSEEANVRLLCRFHNQRAARLVYGEAHMSSFAGGSPSAREPCATYAPAA